MTTHPPPNQTAALAAAARARDANPHLTGRHWPLIVVGLLLLNVAVVTTTVTLAVRNPAEVVPDYYNRALNWDTHRTPAPHSPPAPPTPPAPPAPPEALTADTTEQL